MDYYDPDVFVNRDDPIPVLKIPGDSTPRTAQDEAKQGLRERTAAKLNERFGESSNSLQDRMLNAVLSQMFPSEKEAEIKEPVDKRSSKYVARPQFSLPAMSTNFRRFNARIGVVFAFQNRVIRLLSWKDPAHTLSLLAMYSLVCLNPNLLLALPLAVCVLFIMVPAYLARHPPPTDSGPTEVFDITGPASAPPRNIKPAPEMSKDFFRNMRDLQNSMADFSIIHDALVAAITPVTNFSDEKLSSSVFIVLFALTCVSFIASHLLPFRATFLILGWAAIGSSHPMAQALFATIDQNKVAQRQVRARNVARKWMDSDIILDDAPELREVEVFELQHQSDNGEWERWMYSTLPYTPLSPARINGDRPVGTPFFEDVKPPRGWVWKGKKWNLDLLSREWVEERMITAVEVETEGERWVYDMTPSAVVEPGTGKKSRNVPRQGWEESTGSGRKGEWRRRRWVRLVQRKVMKEPEIVLR